MKKTNRIKELDALRGIAAMAVVFFHYTYGFNHSDQNFIFHYGNLGVYLFFILSGFVITLTLEKSKSAVKFVIARFSRLYPAYWFAVIFLSVLFFVFFHLFPNSASNLIVPISKPQFLANLTMFQFWLHYPDIDGVFWTLAVEMSFYLFILFLLIIKKVHRVEIIGFFFMIAMYINFALNSPLTAYLPLIKYGNLFFAGIVFYNLKTKGSSRLRWFLLVEALIVQLLITNLLETVAVLLFFGIFYLLITDKLKFLRNKVLLEVGFVSYSIYLIHENTGAVIFAIFDKFGVHELWIKIFFSVGIVLILAKAITYLVEQPLIKLIKINSDKLLKKINFNFKN